MFNLIDNKGSKIINIDDEFGNRLKCMLGDSAVTYGMGKEAGVRAENIEFSSDGSSFDVVTLRDSCRLYLPLVGEHNIYNCLAAVSVALGEGFSLVDSCKALESMEQIPGRLERIRSSSSRVYIDYAHTPDALEKVLRTLRKFTQGKLILVFGCGGSRDKSKRAPMGRIASELCDYTIVTNDNPRKEEPESITADILQGFDGTEFAVELNREKAIYSAISMAASHDTVLIAGKGHEEYQEFKDRKIDFSDKKIVEQMVK